MNLRKQIIPLTTLFVLTVTIFSVLIFYSHNATSKFSNITQVNYNQRLESSPITIDDFEKLSKRMSLESVSFTYEAQNITVRESSITPVYTTHNLFKLYNIKLDGEMFSEDDVNNAKNKVVISDTLALQLYFTTDIVGYEIEMFGETFTVCAVYSKSANLIDKLSKDGKERVFIPYTCANSTSQVPIYTMVYDNTSLSAPLVEQMNLSQYHFTNFAEKTKVIDTFNHIAYFVLFVALCVTALLIWFKLCKRLLKDIKEDLSVNYLLKSFLSIPVKYLLFIVIALGIPAILLFIFLKSDFSIYIVAKYIPYDNLFDIKHYINCVVDNAHYMNNLSLFGETYLLNLYANTVNISVWLTLILTVCCTVLTISIVNLILVKLKKI